MTWAALEAEFEEWRRTDLILPFWWRDDDAVAETEELHQLAALSKQVNIPVHIAVIPANLMDNLAPYVRSNPQLMPIAHGFAHLNHADPNSKKCEFPAGRDPLKVAQEIEQGVKTLSDAFGNTFHKVFVPPWNRFDETFFTILQAVGYKGVSTFTPRTSKYVSESIEQVNTHVDPIDWHRTRSLVDENTILEHTVRSLKDRRFGRSDNTEPFGFLTHHLVHDAAIWDFSHRFLAAFAKGPTRLWTAADLDPKGH